MIKRFLTIILFLALSLFLVMPVEAAEQFIKEIEVETEELDYRNSLIDWNGYNMDLTIIWDQHSGNLPTGVSVSAVDYGFQFTASTWDCVDYICVLVLTPTQNQLVKSILFSRTFDENRLILIGGTQQNLGFFLGFRLQFKSLLNINFKSVYIADYYQGSLYETDVDSWEKSITLHDSDDLPILSAVLDDETTQPQIFIQKGLYNFNNKYTNISAVYLNFWNSKEHTAYETTIYNVFYQIGLFADNQVILPDLDIDTDFQIYAPTICGVLDMACVSRNLIGEFSNNIYNQLGADNIASGVMTIYDTLFYPVYIVDDTGWQNGILSLYAMLVVGVLYLIIKRVLS